MKAVLSVGEYATNPYPVKGLNILVYSITELAYVLKENAFLLDMKLFGEDLIDWINDECALKDVGDILRPMLSKKGALSNFVAIIMEASGIYDKDSIFQIKSILKETENLSEIEKSKRQVDYLLNSSQFFLAKAKYDALLSEFKNDNENLALKGKILHNKGVAFAKMFYFEPAAQFFLKAYECASNPQSLFMYLACQKFTMEDNEYREFIEANEDYVEIANELESSYQDILREFTSSKEYEDYIARCNLKEDGKPGEYYEALDDYIESVKLEYKKNVNR